jgi:hypothetical protein
MHKAPVENREGKSSKKAKKKQIVFSLIVRRNILFILMGLATAKG